MTLLQAFFTKLGCDDNLQLRVRLPVSECLWHESFFFVSLRIPDLGTYRRRYRFTFPRCETHLCLGVFLFLRISVPDLSYSRPSHTGVNQLNNRARCTANYEQSYSRQCHHDKSQSGVRLPAFDSPGALTCTFFLGM
jgi:hypothetical protein